MNGEPSQLDLIELVDRLTPVPEPPPVSLWPQTEAWIWVGLVAFALILWLTRLALKRRRANAYRRRALREISVAAGAPAELASIVRRAALVGYPRADVAGLYGDEWLAFLDRTSGGSDFREGPGRAFAQAPYVESTRVDSSHSQPSGSRRTGDSEPLVELAVRWIRHHRSDAGDAGAGDAGRVP